jgi:hypothetical protein
VSTTEQETKPVPSFDELFTHHVGTAMARQLALADVVGECSWQLDLTTGVITIGDDHHYPVQLLGSESYQTDTWLWAWANTESDLPPAVLVLVDEVRRFGEVIGVIELVEPSFRLEWADGHQLALLTGGLTERPYYRALYDGGALFLLLDDAGEEVLAPVAPERAATTISQVLQLYPVDHRAMITAFLDQQGWRIATTAGDGMSARHPCGSTMQIDFDDLDRMCKLIGQTTS